MFFSPRKRNRRSSFGIEQLEVRIVPTVSVIQDGGQLTITGDSSGAKSNDNVTITGTDPSKVDVTHDGTTESFTDVTDITVNTKKGKDTVTVVDLDIEGDLSVNTGSGQDVVDFIGGEGTIGGDLSVSTGTASDKVTLDTIIVGGITNVKLGDHKDTLIVSGSTFEGDLSINTGSGQDTVSISDSHIGNSEAGGDLSVSTGTASDKVTLDTIIVGGITNVKLGDHKDSLIVSGSTFDGKFTADGGNHSDTFDDGGDNTFTGGKVIKHFQKLV